LSSAFACAALTACNTQETVPIVAGSEAPGTVLVTASDVVSGFSVGHLRRRDHVPAFRISTSPTTVGQYRACVDKGACTAPTSRAAACRGLGGLGAIAGPTYERPEGSLPVTCVTVAQARAFCAWVGGALPKPSAWMLAARGTSPRRYAWGDAPATCEERPDTLDDPREPVCAPPDGAGVLALFRVGRHPRGASPFGVEDVLLSEGEIIDADDGAQFPACAPPRSGCIVRGARPGAIDSLEPIENADDTDESVMSAAGFRCVFPESK
jgi:hypothetical protein